MVNCQLHKIKQPSPDRWSRKQSFANEPLTSKLRYRLTPTALSVANGETEELSAAAPHDACTAWLMVMTGGINAADQGPLIRH